MVSYVITNLVTRARSVYKSRSNAILDFKVLKSLGYAVSLGVQNEQDSVKECIELAR